VFGVAWGHLLGLCLASLKSSHRWVLAVTGIAIVLLAIVLSALIIGESWDEEEVMKFIAVLSIIIAAGTLAIPILHRIDRSAAAEAGEKKLILSRRPDGTWHAPDGRIFVVRELEP